MRDFLSEQLFVDKYILSQCKLLHTLGVAIQGLIYRDLHEKALPLASLMEYFSCDITKSKVLTVKARLLKIIALIEIGYLNEAYQLYTRVLAQKDLLKPATRDSVYMNKKEGKNFFFPQSQKYYNNLSQEHEKNAEAISNISKPIP